MTIVYQCVLVLLYFTSGCRTFTQEVTSTRRHEIVVKATKNHVLKSIELVKKLSTQPCVRNVMYGNSLIKWWVKRGCAGEFKLEECPMHGKKTLYEHMGNIWCLVFPHILVPHNLLLVYIIERQTK